MLIGHIKDANGDPIRKTAGLDKSTEVVITASYPHHETHNASMFSAWTEIDPVTNGEYLAIGFTTPNTAKRVHLIMSFIAEAQGWVELVSAPVLTPASGAPLVGFCRRQDCTSAYTLVDLSTYDNAGVVGGTVLDRVEEWSNKLETATSRDSDEWILAPNRSYAVRFTADAASGAIVKILWYEHTDRNVIV